MLERVAEPHAREALRHGEHEPVHLVCEPRVEPRGGGARRPHRRVLSAARERGTRPLELGGEREDGAVGDGRVEVRVEDPVARVGAREAGRVGAPLLARLQQADEVALGLGHLFGVDLHVAVAKDRARVLCGVVLPYSRVVVETHRQVVRDQVLARHAHVHRVPKLELAPHARERCGRDRRLARRRLVRLPEQHVVPKALGALLGRDGRRCAVGAKHRAALQQVRDGVVGHVDG
mmetsp:Transcript_34139/g.109649  ORF Transcript_34139/g.109649 Transcript_34139/m.109649 type:complete len:234 (-) Transcript_34139:2159-2860(-)